MKDNKNISLLINYGQITLKRTSLWGLLLASLVNINIANANEVDSDLDGISDAIEGMVDSDDDGLPNAYDTDSDGDGLGDILEGLGDADSDGTPNYLDLDSDNDGLSDSEEGGYDNLSQQSVSVEFLETIAQELPESRDANPVFLNPSYRTDVTLSEAASAEITFIDEGAGFRNSLGYYIFPSGSFDGLTKSDIDRDQSGVISLAEILLIPGVEIGWVFPNASKQGAGGDLNAGDTVVLGNNRIYPRGTVIGFFLAQNAWTGAGIREPNTNGTAPLVFFSSDFLNPEASSGASSGYNPSNESSRHVALLFANSDREEIIMGFEDLHRTNRSLNHWNIASDEDFNDAVFRLRTTPRSAIGSIGIATISTEGSDSDGDTILDADERNGDSDNDGLEDIYDPDDDGDGIATPVEGTGDPDGDGSANYLDNDSDGDGVSDAIEQSRDSDLDGIPDFLDLDSDNDGLSDELETGLDSDNDGKSNRIDNDDDGDGIPTAEEGTSDYDNDGIADYLDIDSDNDGVRDDEEDVGDTDNDGLIDRFDIDDDGDGILTIDEGNEDLDKDGIGNHVDLDSDGDSYSDAIEGSIDTDSDGIVNRLDTDDDGDGVDTAREGDNDPDSDGVPNYLDSDSDGDGIEDGLDYVELHATTLALQENYTGAPLYPGEAIHYTLSIENTGLETAELVAISGLIPENTRYESGSLSIDSVASSDTLTPDSILTINSIQGGQNLIIQWTVIVREEMPPEARYIESRVTINHDSSSYPVVSDNDPNGHCGIFDDGIDHPEDIDQITGDDDPTRLPLSQATQYEHCTLAFEDLQNAGWNDWDMNDLILDIYSYYTLAPDGGLELLVVSYQPLARGAGMDSQLHLNLSFRGFAEWQTVYINTDGEIENTSIGFDIDKLSVKLWQSSKDALPPYTDLKYQWGAARTERFDTSEPGKRAVIRVYFDSPEINPLETFSVNPHDSWIYTPGTRQEIHQIEYSLASSQIVYSGPLMGRSLPFVIKLDEEFTWPAEGQAIWDSHPEYVNFIRSGRTAHFDWAETIDIWRVWFDRNGRMPGREELNPAATSIYYIDYVDTHKK